MAQTKTSVRQNYHSKKVSFYEKFFKYAPFFSLIEFAAIFLQDAIFLLVKYKVTVEQFFCVFTFVILLFCIAGLYLFVYSRLWNKGRYTMLSSLGYIVLYTILVVNVFEQALLPYKANTISRVIAFNFNLFVFGITTTKRFFLPGTACYSLYPVVLYLGLEYLGPIFGFMRDQPGYEANIDLFSMAFITIPFVIVEYILELFFDKFFDIDMNAREKLVILANQDQLTGLYNRNYFSHMTVDEKFEHLKNPDVYFIMIDIDDFKRINDVYGHNEGDNVLKNLSSIIQSNIRVNVDFAIRWGGEEILIVAENVLCNNDAVLMAERIRNCVEATGKFTISLGVCQYNAKYPITRNINLVDRALYMSKDAGKNTTTFLSE